MTAGGAAANARAPALSDLGVEHSDAPNVPSDPEVVQLLQQQSQRRHLQRG